jgi:hypothetical protein
MEGWKGIVEDWSDGVMGRRRECWNSGRMEWWENQRSEIRGQNPKTGMMEGF